MYINKAQEWRKIALSHTIFSISALATHFPWPFKWQTVARAPRFWPK